MEIVFETYYKLCFFFFLYNLQLHARGAVEQPKLKALTQIESPYWKLNRNQAVGSPISKKPKTRRSIKTSHY